MAYVIHNVNALSIQFLKNISFYHLKSYFIYYTIAFYNIANIANFIFEYNILKLYKLKNKIIYKKIYLTSFSNFYLSISLSQQTHHQPKPRTTTHHQTQLALPSNQPKPRTTTHHQP